MSEKLDPDLLHFFAEAFDSFDSATDKLTEAYTDLERRLETVNQELEQTNRELKQSLVEKEELHDKLACILESMTASVIAVDLNGNISLFNHAAESLTGMESEKAMGQLYETLFSDRPYLLHTLQEGKPYKSHEGFIKNPKLTEPIAVEISTNLISTANGDVLGALEIVHNISERKQLEEQLSRSAALAELGKMAAEVAHDLRNPLGAIRLYAGMLQQELKDDRKELADSVVRGLDSLETITYNLLSLARPVKAKFEFVDLNELLDGILSLTQPAMDEKDISLKWCFDAENRVVCYGDFEQLKQAMLNLVLNAIQAMPDGGDLEIHVGTDSEKELVTLCIADDGQGIPTDIQEKIFTPFFTTKPTGTGLGLHTVNRIVQAHYGRIRVVSAEGTGTQFVVELPRDARQLQPPVFQVGIEPIQAVN
tara:strand:+ start:48 stop:1319 length:1272 start_codon:yes stop_codon:yes gene_type:complete